MKLFPSFESFAAVCADGAPQIVWTRRPADLETPVGAYLKLGGAEAEAADGGAFLLESVAPDGTRGRYATIGLAPDLIWRCKDGRAEINRDALRDAGAFAPCVEKPLESLRALVAESRIDPPPESPPLAAGLFGYLGYDMAREMERLPPAKPDAIDAPDAVLLRPTVILIVDAALGELFLATPVRARPNDDAAALYAQAQARLEAIFMRLEGPLPAQAAADPRLCAQAPVSNTTEADFLAMVERGRDYIRAGDVFQVVLTQRYSAPFALPPFDLYRALRRINPSPFLCYFDFRAFQIVCCSPEIMVRTHAGEVSIRPIAGTRPRGETPEEDDALARELIASEKDRAEHLMLVDLCRNDAGRVAEIGTVRAEPCFMIERYSHVMHIVSHVTGRLDPQRDAIDALIAGFPSGTVSGAPKLRAMEIIDELETDRRGIYYGCMAYFDANGDMDSCIIQRTALLKDGIMHVQAGAGVVYDSDPAWENAESGHKARALFCAAEEAVRRATQPKKGQ